MLQLFIACKWAGQPSLKYFVCGYCFLHDAIHVPVLLRLLNCNLKGFKLLEEKESIGKQSWVRVGPKGYKLGERAHELTHITYQIDWHPSEKRDFIDRLDTGFAQLWIWFRSRRDNNHIRPYVVQIRAPPVLSSERRKFSFICRLIPPVASLRFREHTWMNYLNKFPSYLFCFLERLEEFLALGQS